MDRCPYCLRPAGDPTRYHDRTGALIAGCVMSYHDAAMMGDTWHDRPAAKAIREGQRRRQEASTVRLVRREPADVPTVRTGRP